LFERIAHQLQDAIDRGDYAPGERLPAERQLAETFGVSRPVVREAISALELRNVVHRRRGAGVFVATAARHVATPQRVDQSGPFEVVETRRLIEGEVAALAATTVSGHEIAEMERLVNRIGDGNLTQTARETADRAFHIALAKATRNDVLVALVRDLWDARYHSPLCIYLFDRARAAGIDPPENDHRLVLDAVRAGDAEAARQAMRDHLTRVTQNLLIATEADVLDRARLRVEERRLDFARRAGLNV
jgi:DNA-binding FadR family transcriptional regulator